MDYANVGSISIIAIIMVILFSIIYDPSSITYVILAILMLFAMASKSPKRKEDTVLDVSIAEEKEEEEEVTLPKPEQPPPETKKDESFQTISDANRYALDQMYGRRGTSIDDKMTAHRQRIGDRDRKATIAQIKGRRNNALEPYYRQELSQHGAKKWWDPDSVLIRKATSEQMKTIMRGPNPYK